MELLPLLKIMVEKSGSDIYLTNNAAPSMKIDGKMSDIADTKLKSGDVYKIAQSIMDEKQRQEFDENLEMNLALAEPGVGRFRVNIFVQRGEAAMVIRRIVTDIPKPEDLGVPPVLKDVVLKKRGLVLVVGATGSGKSTTLASMINHRNLTAHDHIITIEDPVEFVHDHQKCIVNQREVGTDTHSYEAALKNTLRQAPDVILIGEIRARETMEHAMAFAETGHLCMSTLHANNANQGLQRIINFFPEEAYNLLMLDLSLNLEAVISQRLVPGINGGRVPAVEILLATPQVKDQIKKGDINGLKETMEKSEHLGMQTFDGALYNLYMEGKISFEDALRNADSENNLRLRIQLEEKGTDADGGIDTSDLSLKKDDDEQ